MALDTRELAQLITQAVIKAPGASIGGIKAELYDVLKEFLSDGATWREAIQFQATADTAAYTLVPNEGQIIRLMGVWDDKGIPVPAVMEDFGTITLIHAPASTPAAKWVARVEKTITPPITKDGVPIAPAWVLGVYSITVLDGILGKMMAQPDKSYSNQTLSGYHLRRFRTGIQIARTAQNRANLKGGQSWSFPQGAVIGSQRGGVSTAWPTTVM